jgi:hypothetical protein
MTFARTDTTTENKKLADLPTIYENETVNVDYLNDLGSYFDDHFAFRNNLVNLDSIIQSNIFDVSNSDTVIKGENGWLYYSDTLNDYLGSNTLSDRGIYNIVSNISIIQKYVEDRGADFVFTIAPNKNSLYDDNMPYYYSVKASENKNINSLSPLLSSNNINYSDLFSLFENYDETLYLKRDSHWNNKGAMLAYNEIMNKLGYEHNDYSSVKAVRTKTEYGDLNKMLYPVSGEPEWNYYYQYDYSYKYKNDAKSVEDPWIETTGNGTNGKLLMFRDSFGNTLLPFFAEEFSEAYFSKATPYSIEEFMDKYNPNCVVIEKVERNLDEFASAPPLLTGSSADINVKKNAETNTTLSVENTELSSSYLSVSGVVDEKYIETQTNIYINVNLNGKDTAYRAFNLSDDSTDNGYLLYLPKSEFENSTSVKFDVIVENNGTFCNVKSVTTDLSKLY